MFGIPRRRPYITAFSVIFFALVGWSAIDSPYPAEKVVLGGVFFYLPIILFYLFMIWIFSVIPKPADPRRSGDARDGSLPRAGSQRVPRCAHCGADLLIDATKCRDCGKIVSAP